MRSLFLQDIIGSRFSTKDKLFYVLIACFLLTLFLPTMPVINNMVIGLIVVFSFFYNSGKEKWALLKSRKALPFILLFFLFHIISTFFSNNREEAITMLLMRTPLLLFPVAFGLIKIGRELRDRIWWLYSIVTTLAAILCLIWALIMYGRTGDASQLYNDSLSLAIGKQSIYFAMMVNVAVVALICLLSGHASFINRPLAYSCIILLLIIHFMLASRISIILLYAFLGVYTFYHVIILRRRLLAGLALLIGLLIGGLLLIKLFPKTLNRFRELNYTQYSFQSLAQESHYDMEVKAEQWNGANVRLAIWQCGWELAQKNFLWGVPLGDKMDTLIDTYRSKGFQFAINPKRNLHNNYLDVLVTFGILGLLVFLLGYFILPLMYCIKDRNLLGGFIVIALAIALITETYMDRSIGNVLLGLFIPFVISCRRVP